MGWEMFLYYICEVGKEHLSNLQCKQPSWGSLLFPHFLHKQALGCDVSIVQNRICKFVVYIDVHRLGAWSSLFTRWQRGWRVLHHCTRKACCIFLKFMHACVAREQSWHADANLYGTLPLSSYCGTVLEFRSGYFSHVQAVPYHQGPYDPRLPGVNCDDEHYLSTGQAMKKYDTPTVHPCVS